ncbi:hypothetical protein FXO38_10805 [Capsicum annuum]|nr:hypothetical protein FXO38_10805 [Capsicum annuum]
MVEELKEGELSTIENSEESTQYVEEAREVEDIGPKEHASRRTRAERETEEPLESGGFAPPPEPTSFPDFSGGGEEDSGEYGEGDEGHGEGVDGGDRAERERTAVAEEEEEEEMEEDGEEDVGSYGGEEEGPRVAP